VASAYGAHGIPGVNVTIWSAGWDDGNGAKIYFDGVHSDISVSHGLNVIFLNLDGTYHSSDTFNPERNGSAELVAAIEKLPMGSPVVVATQDDGHDGLTNEARAALASCGAALLSDLHWRSSYALIGIKGAAALAEAVSARGNGTVQVSARYAGAVGSFLEFLPTTITATTTTTTLPPQCGTFECGPGLMHKAEAWKISASSDEECCETAVPGIMSVVVRSAGHGNGNLAEFYLNGLRASTVVRRGINILELRNDGAPKKSMSFDTHASGSDGLVAFVDALAEGTRVLVAARDEAASNFTDAARAALEDCGAHLIRNLTYRGAYVLIGTKGGAALAERVLPDGTGIAEVSAHVEITEPDPSASKPPCPARSANPPVKGGMSGSQFQLDVGCRYALFDSAGVSKCLASSWMVVVGGSNTVLMTIRLANMLAEDAILPVRDGATMGGFNVIDIIIKDGVKVYGLARNFDGCSALPHSADCKAEINTAVAEAPAPVAGATRITLFSAQFWDHALDGVEAAQAKGAAWLHTKVAFLVQVSTWDIYCAGMKVKWCPRPELSDESLSDKDAMALFNNAMTPVLDKLQALCAPGQPAGILGCVVTTTTFQNPARSRIPIYEAYNNAIRSAMSSRSSETLRLVDLWVMGQAMPDENVLGHGSPMLNLWNWQVMLSGMCPDEDAAPGIVAQFKGELCFGDEARRNAEHMTKCPEYRDTCKSTPRCEPWECANSLPCTLEPVAGGPEPDTNGMCEAKVVLLNAKNNLHDVGVLCKSLWCAADMEWLPATLAGVFALLLIAIRYFGGSLNKLLPKRLNRETPSEVKTQCAKRSGTDSTIASGSSDLLSQGVSQETMVQSSTEVDHSGDGLSVAAPSTSSPPESQVEEVVIPIGIDVIASCEAPATTAPSVDAPDVKGAQQQDTQVAVEALDPAVVPEAMMEQQAAPLAPTRRKAGDKFPLGLARFCASMHVVIGHLYAKGITPKQYFFGWGFTWVPWFFMLSGFVLFTAHLRRPKEEGVFEYVIRRSVSIYPLYAFSLLPAIIFAKVLGHVPCIQALVAQSFLVQAWWPGWTEQALQSHCWFLSAMVFYWFLFKPLSRCLQNFSFGATLATMIALFALPWLVIVVPVIADQPILWFSAHSWGQTSTLLDLAVVFLKFNPACYLHVFVLGMLLAKLRLLLDEKAKASRNPRSFCLPMEFLAPLGYLGLFLIFALPELRPLGFKLSARLSVLLPLQAAVLLGLAGLPSMPIGRFAQFFAYFNFLENYSYAVYVFQFLGYSVWPERGEINLFAFLIFCIGTSVIIATLVQGPVQKWWKHYTRARLAVPFVLAAVLVGVALLPDANPNPDVAVFIRHDNRMLDTRLPLVDSKGSSMGLLMNPSLAVHDGRVLITARRHKLEVTLRNGWYNHSSASIEDQTWHSDVLLGTADLDVEAWARWPTSGEAPFQASLTPFFWLRTPENQRWRHLCAPEEYDQINNTLVRHVVTGPEDAKVFLHNGSISVSFNSLPPLGEESCSLGQDVSQMYLASEVSMDGKVDSIGRHLQCGATDAAEKNWIPFEHQGKMHFVYSPLPHKIVRAEEDGSCSDVFSTGFEPLAALKRNNSHLEIRASGQAVFVNDTVATPSLPRPHFLAALHIFDSKLKTYSHFLYRFSDEAPFNILQVSSQLLLVEAKATESPGKPFAFVSGLAVVNRTVVISYGSGDRDARALVMTLDRLDELFTCAGAMADHPGNVSSVNASAVGNTSSAER